MVSALHTSAGGIGDLLQSKLGGGGAGCWLE